MKTLAVIFALGLLVFLVLACESPTAPTEPPLPVPEDDWIIGYFTGEWAVWDPRDSTRTTVLKAWHLFKFWENGQYSWSIYDWEDRVAVEQGTWKKIGPRPWLKEKQWAIKFCPNVPPANPDDWYYHYVDWIDRDSMFLSGQKMTRVASP